MRLSTVFMKNHRKAYVTMAAHAHKLALKYVFGEKALIECPNDGLPCGIGILAINDSGRGGRGFSAGNRKW